MDTPACARSRRPREARILQGRSIRPGPPASQGGRLGNAWGPGEAGRPSSPSPRSLRVPPPHSGQLWAACSPHSASAASPESQVGTGGSQSGGPAAPHTWERVRDRNSQAHSGTTASEPLFNTPAPCPRDPEGTVAREPQLSRVAGLVIFCPHPSAHPPAGRMCRVCVTRGPLISSAFFQGRKARVLSVHSLGCFFSLLRGGAAGFSQSRCWRSKRGHSKGQGRRGKGEGRQGKKEIVQNPRHPVKTRALVQHGRV